MTGNLPLLDRGTVDPTERRAVFKTLGRKGGATWSGHSRSCAEDAPRSSPFIVNSFPPTWVSSAKPLILVGPWAN